MGCGGGIVMMGILCQKKIIPPKIILLFNGNHGDTTTSNAGSSSDLIQLISGASISTAQSYEGNASCRLQGGAYLLCQNNGSNNSGGLSQQDFYISIAFRLDVINNVKRGLFYCEAGSHLMFEAYVENGHMTIKARQVNGTYVTFVVPNFVAVANIWYKFELTHNVALDELTAKVGADSITQAFTGFSLNTWLRLMVGHYWSGAAWEGYVDRLIIRVGSTTAY